MFKRKIFIIVIFVQFLIIHNSFTQNINYGVSGGINRATKLSDSKSQIITVNPENYFNIMAIVEINHNPTSRFHTGLKYSKMGWTSEFNDNSRWIASSIIEPSKSISTTLSYLSVPMDINLFLPFFPALFISGGFEVAYFLSGDQVSFKYDGSTSERNINNEFRDFTLLLMIGFGYEFKINNVSLFIEPEYSRSIIDVTKDSESVSSFNIERISLNIGVKL